MVPKRLLLRNFMSHDESEINFDKFNLALILGSYSGDPDISNGSGKSTLFESIAWALFGKSRHKKKNKVVKRDKSLCRVEFEFFIGSELYRIVRERDKVVDDTTVVFERFDGSDFVSISCDTNSLTDDKIINTIKVDYDVFINSSYFKQQDISMFTETSPGKRKDIIKSLLKMDKWDLYQKATKNKINSLADKIEEKSKLIVPIDNIRSNIISCNESIAGLKKKIKDTNTEREQTNAELLSKKIEHSNLSNSSVANELNNLQKEFTVAKNRVAEINKKISENNEIIKKQTQFKDSTSQKISLLKEKVKQAKKINLADLKSKIIKGCAREQFLKDSILTLKSDFKLAGKCDLCKRLLTKSESDAIRNKRKKELESTQVSFGEISAQLKRANSKLKELEGVVSEGNKAEMEAGKLELTVSKSKDLIAKSLLENTNIEQEKKSLMSKNYKKDILDLKDKFNKEYEQSLSNAVSSLETRLQEINRNVGRLNIEYGSAINKRNELTVTEKKQEEYQNELDVLNGELYVYEKLRDYFGKDGIQSVIIENVVEELENYSNETLSKICNEPTTISIQTQKQNDNGSWSETFDIVVKINGQADDIESLSTGEQFRIALALRLALSNILANRMGGTVKFLLLDEVSSSLDNKGVELFVDIIKKLSVDMKILVITHDEKLKDKIKNIIVVDKTATGSRVIY